MTSLGRDTQRARVPSKGSMACSRVGATAVWQCPRPFALWRRCGGNACPDLLGLRVVVRPRVTADAAGPQPGSFGWPAVGRIAPRAGRARRSGHLAGRRRGGRSGSSRRRRDASVPSVSAMSLSNAAVWWQVVSMAISGLGVTALPPGVPKCGRLPPRRARLE